MGTIDSLGTDIANEMLLALTSDDKPVNKVTHIPKHEMCTFLKRNIDRLDIQDRKVIGEILIMNNHKSHIKPCAEGVAINLQNLDTAIIRQMYDLTQYKLSRIDVL